MELVDGDVPHRGALSKKIKWTSVVMLLLGCTLTVVAYVIATLVAMPQWTGVVKEEMLEEETGSLLQLAQNKAIFATEVLSRVRGDLELISDFATDAFQGDAPAQPYLSYPAIPAQGHTIADGTYGYTATDTATDTACRTGTLSTQTGAGCPGQSWEHSNYYLPGRTAAGEDQAPHTRALLDRTAGIDLAFRSLNKIYGLDGTLLYIGLEDPDTGEPTDPAPQAIYKTYPGEDMTGYATWSDRWCDARWTPAAGDPAALWQRRQAPAGSQHPGTQRRAEWYDPRCRGWYQDARETKDVIFTAPYTDANSGLLVMTAAAPIYLDPDTKENFVGVIAIDFSIADLDDTILGTQILGDGYAYLMSTVDGGAVIHKDQDRSSPPCSLEEPGQCIRSLEQATDAAFWPRMRSGCTSLPDEPAFMRSDRTTWLVSFAPELAVGTAENCPSPIPNTLGYSVGLTVSEEEVHAPFAALDSRIQDQIFQAILFVAAAIAAALVLMSYVAHHIARSTAKPVINLLRLVHQLNKGKFMTKEAVDALVGDHTKQDSPEVGVLVEAFRTMMTVVQAANTQLHAGQYEGALGSYSEALTLFHTMDNQRGIGTCNNNIAVAYMERAASAAGSRDQAQRAMSFQLARTHLEEAVENARNTIRDAHSAAAAADAKRTLAHRLFVWATLLTRERDHGQLSAHGEQVAREALETAEETGVGPLRLLECRCMVATVASACGGAREAAKKWQEAEGYVRDYREGPSGPPQCALQQRLLVEQAKDAEQRGDNAQADALRREALETGPHANFAALMEAAKALSERGGMIEYGRQALATLRSKPKAVMFVLDYSGSMAGSQIRTCVESICMILAGHMGPKDQFALTVFNNRVQPKVPWMVKRNNEAAIEGGIRACNNPTQGTAIWDAVFHATSRKPPSPAPYWICLLTDGDDNSSRNTQKDLVDKLTQVTEEGALEGMIAIGAGAGVEGPTKIQLKELADATKHGIMIESGADPSSIESAFMQAAEVMAGNNLVEEYA